MKLETIYNRLKTLGIPVAYSHFPNAVNPPFCCYIVTSEKLYGADNINLLRNRLVRIELYTNKKDEQLESRIEKLFYDTELEKSETYISDEQLYEVMYDFEILMKLED